MTTWTPASQDDTPFQTGRDEFAALLDQINARGWTALCDPSMAFYGPYEIRTPNGAFRGHGFGRATSLGIAYTAALAAEPTTEGATA